MSNLEDSTLDFSLFSKNKTSYLLVICKLVTNENNRRCQRHHVWANCYDMGLKDGHTAIYITPQPMEGASAIDILCTH